MIEAWPEASMPRAKIFPGLDLGTSRMEYLDLLYKLDIYAAAANISVNQARLT